jgi:ABC-type Mn2+/Zn2+ transport system permease subunit
MNSILEMLAFPSIRRAVIVGALIALCAALLGVSLVLKRFSMIGDGLSHVGFGALALATVMNLSPLEVSIPIVVAAAFLLLRLSDSSKIKGDAAIAIISTGALAIGVMLISTTSNGNVDLMNYMFGSILAMKASDVWLSLVLSAVVLAVYIISYWKIFAITFDETFVRATGVRTGFYNSLLAVLTAVTIVLGMRLMGSLLISSLIIFPALTAMRVYKSFKGVVICAGSVSVVGLISGIVLSYLLSVPVGASIVCVDIVLFLLFCLVGKIRR